MATGTTPVLTEGADFWEDCYDSAVCSGIVGDLAHRQRGGYHISIEDQPNTNFSVIRVDDKAPPGDWPRDKAAAIDMNLALPDMKVCHARFKAVWLNRHNDPRAKFFNVWNGWDGNGSAGRYNFVTGTIQEATSDHKWHIHLEIRRRYVNSREMLRALKSIVSGETLAQYLGEDMALDKDDLALFRAEMKALLTKDVEVSNQFSGGAWSYNRGGLPGDLATTAVPKPNALNYFSVMYLNLKALLTGFNTFVRDEAARDAQEAARDAALATTLQTLLELTKQGQSVALSDGQFVALMDHITQKVAEAGQDAADQQSAKITLLADAIAEAGEALTRADDQPQITQ